MNVRDNHCYMACGAVVESKVTKNKKSQEMLDYVRFLQAYAHRSIDPSYWWSAQRVDWLAQLLPELRSCCLDGLDRL